ncbi:MAG: arylesterase [Steroidobacteraceae bacterium]
MKHVVAAWFALLLCGSPPTHAAAPRALLVFGDSLSAGYGIKVEESWPALLQERLRSQGYGYRVVNASVSGETTSGGAERLPRALRLHRPGIVILELGGNDGLRGLPLATSRANLERMIRACKTARARVLLVGMRIPPNYGPRYVQAFEQMYRELARTQAVRLLPFLLEDVALDATAMQADGLHPNARGSARLLENVWPQLRPMLR